MLAVSNKKYHRIEDYCEFQKVFHSFGIMLLFAMTEKATSVREHICRNYIARTIVMLRSIFSMWESGDVPDCWVVHRCMMDRLFHLHQLIEDNSFAAFDDWSFVQQYNLRNKVRSDGLYNPTLIKELWKGSPEDKARIARLKTTPPMWKRPFAEDTAKAMGLKPLYDYGFDYGSQFVHPMANDGYKDFIHLTKLDDGSVPLDETAVIHNSCLAAVVTLREAMLGSEFLWRGFVRDMSDHLFEFIENGAKVYQSSFVKLASQGPEIMSIFCEKPPSPTIPRE